MNAQDKLEIIAILSAQRGDDLQRARFAFGKLTEKQMQEQHGLSGKTRAEILAGYEARDRRLLDLIAEVELLPR